MPNINWRLARQRTRMRVYGIENWRSLGSVARALTQSTAHRLAAPRRKQAFVAWRAGHRGAAS
jgi:hypothetical protein